MLGDKILPIDYLGACGISTKEQTNYPKTGEIQYSNHHQYAR